jgi:hypothetical protein
MKKSVTILMVILFLMMSMTQVMASEPTLEQKMKSVEGKYTIKVKVDRWTNSPSFDDQDFPDVSQVHEVEVEIRYEGQKPGYTTPIFSVYVDGQKTDTVKVGFSSSGGSGLFVTANNLPVPSLGNGRTIKGSLKFNYDSDATQYTLNEEPAATMIMDATFAVGHGKTSMAPAPIETEGNSTSSEGSISAGGTDNAEPVEDTANGDQIDEGFVEEEGTAASGEEGEEQVVEEEVIEEEVSEEDKESESEEDEYEVVTQGLEGNITDSRGRVMVTMPDGSTRRVRKRMPLPEGSTVRVYKNSWCEIKLNTGDIMQMRGLAVFTLPETVIEKKNPGLLERGKALFKSTTETVKDKLGFGELEIETPSAVAGKRGTVFYVEVDEEGTSTFLLQEGAILVTDQTGNEKLLESGMKAVVEKGKPLVQTNYTEAEAKVFEEGLDVGFQFPWLLLLIAVVVILFFYLRGKKKKAPAIQPVQSNEPQATSSPQEGIRHCSQCGHALKPTSKFCSNCGKTI